MKTFLTYCLVILIMTLSVGVWLVSVPMANFIKSRAGGQMQQTSNQLRLRLRPDAFKRVGAGELVFEGRLYDVVSEQRQDDWIELVVYRDDLEAYFLQFLMLDGGIVNFSGDGSLPLKTIIENILRLEFDLPPRPLINLPAPSFCLSPKTEFLSGIPAKPGLKVPFPPPQSRQDRPSKA